MTKEQMEICKIIIKYNKLEDILRKSHIEDYCALQEKFYPRILDFSDYEFEDDTIVYLTNELLEEYEKQKDEIFYHRWPLIISVIALIVSIFAVLATIGSDSILWSIVSKGLQR